MRDPGIEGQVELALAPLMSPVPEQIAEFMFFGSFLSLHRRTLPPELDRADGTELPAHLTGVLLVHVEKVCHHRPDHGLTLAVRGHRHRAPEYLERAPILDDIV